MQLGGMYGVQALFLNCDTPLTVPTQMSLPTAAIDVVWFQGRSGA